MFAKIEVNGDEVHPLYKWLRSEKWRWARRSSGTSPSSLVGRDGHVIKRYAPTVGPETPAEDIALAS